MRYDTSRIETVYKLLIKKLPAKLAEEMEGLNVHYLTGLHQSDREFARCCQRPVRIELSVELNDERRCVIRGILAHEIAHALVLLGAVDPPDSWRDLEVIERHADVVAEKLFGERIYYDDRGVQCSGKGARGARPRPEGLLR